MSTAIARSSKQLGRLIQDFRRKRGLNQTELANLAGLRQEMVSKIETGREGVRLGNIYDILAALDLEMTLAPRIKSSAKDIEDIF
jgi:HTH-type transcriptional regulator/antitoxin HipB